jgi:predicted transcriptional regulator
MKLIEAVQRKRIEKVQSEEAQIIRLIRDQPGITRIELISILGIPLSRMGYRLRCLAARGIIRPKQGYELSNDLRIED